MALPGKKLTLRPTGLSDALDGGNAFAGAMRQLVNLVPDPTTNQVWVPRPAATLLTDFAGFVNPGLVSGLLVVGDIAYGTVASDLNAGHDEPFAYNLASGTFLTVGGILAANTPTSPPPSGDWTPPILCQIGTQIVVAHAGFAGGAVKFGWFDISGFTDATHTGSTNSNTTLNGLSANVLAAGWRPGMTISSSAGDIPAGTTIVSIAVGGLSLVLSQAATGTNAGATMTVAGGTPVAPLWAAGDCNLNSLPSVPVGVAQMNGRAWFACGVNGIPFSDVLNATSRTNASQALTTNDGLAVTAIGPLGLSALTGGIVQALIAFEGVSKMQQITGDPVTSNLAMNVLPVSTGTNAPLSLCSTEYGLAFVSPEGMRVIDFTARVSDPIGDAGAGVTVPFINAQFPSRICGAAAAHTLRLSVKNGGAAGAPVQEYWYDLGRKTWSGPHSFPASQIALWRNTFVLAASGINAKLWRSDATPSASSTYTENGIALSWLWQTTLLPDNDEMAMNAMVETTLALQLGLNPVSAQFLDENGSPLDMISFPPGGTPSLWGSAVWGVDVWSGSASPFRQRALNWNVPLVFKQGSMLVAGNSVAGLRVGNLYMKWQILGYKLEAA